MKVRKSSWHYRVWRWIACGTDDETINLCSYFWGVVFGVLGLFCGSWLVLCLLYLVAKCLWLAIYYGFIMTNIGIYALAALALCAIIVFILIGFKNGIDWLIWRWKRRPARQPSPPSLVLEYLRAKKQRMCPLIEFVDEDAG